MKITESPPLRFLEDEGLFPREGKIKGVDSFDALIKWLIILTIIEGSITGGLFIGSVSSIQAEYGFSGKDKGYLSASYGVAAALFSIPIGIGGKASPQVWLAVGGVLVSASAVWYAFSTNIYMFIAAHFCVGMGGTVTAVLGPIHIDNQIDIDKSLVPKYTSYLLASIALGVVLGIGLFIPFANNNCSSTTSVLCESRRATPTVSMTSTLTVIPDTPSDWAVAEDETCFGIYQQIPYLICAILTLIPSVVFLIGRKRYPGHLLKYQVDTSTAVSGVSACSEFWKLSEIAEPGYLCLEFQQTYYHVSEVVVRAAEMSFPGIPVVIKLDPSNIRPNYYTRLRQLTSKNSVAVSIETKPDDGESLQSVATESPTSEVMMRLVTNPRYLCLVAASAADQFVVDAIATFLTEFIEEEHGQTKSVANVVLAATIPAMFLGSVFGGWLSKHYGWGVRGMTMLAWTSSGVSIALCTAVLHPNFVVFAVFFVLALFVVFVSVAPIITAMERVVEESDRELALGVNNFAAKIIGSIFGPILLGTLIDQYPCHLSLCLFGVASIGFTVVAVSVFFAWAIHTRGDYEDFSRQPTTTTTATTPGTPTPKHIPHHHIAVPHSTVELTAIET